MESEESVENEIAVWDALSDEALAMTDDDITQSDMLQLMREAMDVVEISDDPEYKTIPEWAEKLKIAPSTASRKMRAALAGGTVTKAWVRRRQGKVEGYKPVL